MLFSLLASTSLLLGLCYGGRFGAIYLKDTTDIVANKAATLARGDGRQIDLLSCASENKDCPAVYRWDDEGEPRVRFSGMMALQDIVTFFAAGRKEEAVVPAAPDPAPAPSTPVPASPPALTDVAAVRALAGSASASSRVVVMFHAPWCGHCKSAMPEFESAATELPGRVATVDCDAHKEVCLAFGVKGYPSFLVFDGDQVRKYRGGRDRTQIIKVANGGNNEVLHDHAVEPEAQGQQQAPTTVTTTPPLPALTDIAAVRKIASKGSASSRVVVMFHAPWCGHCKSAMPEFESAATDLPGRVATVDCDAHKEVCLAFGVKGYPSFLVFDGDQVRKYRGGRDRTQIIKVANGGNNEVLHDHAVEPEAQGQQQAPTTVTTTPPLPALTDVAAVKKIASKGSASSRVVVMFHAPWCGHCKSAMPEFESAATELAGRVATVDCDAHKDVCLAFGVKGYPSFLVFDGHQVRKYRGGRDRTQIIKVANGGNNEVLHDHEVEPEAHRTPSNPPTPTPPTPPTPPSPQTPIDTLEFPEPPATLPEGDLALLTKGAWRDFCENRAVLTLFTIPFSIDGLVAVFRRAAGPIRSLGTHGRLAMVDCSGPDAAVCAHYGVTEFPSIHLIKNMKRVADLPTEPTPTPREIALFLQKHLGQCL